MSNSATPWTVAHQALLSMGFPRGVPGQELEQDAVRETWELLLRQSFWRRIEDLLRLSEMVGA